MLSDSDHCMVPIIAKNNSDNRWIVVMSNNLKTFLIQKSSFDQRSFRARREIPYMEISEVC